MKQRKPGIPAMSAMTERVWLGSAALSENLLLRLYELLYLVQSPREHGSRQRLDLNARYHQVHLL